VWHSAVASQAWAVCKFWAVCVVLGGLWGKSGRGTVRVRGTLLKRLVGVRV